MTASATDIDWWFDWHPDQAIRYRIWHPAAAPAADVPADR
jgi:hypothetical protein